MYLQSDLLLLSLVIITGCATPRNHRPYHPWLTSFSGEFDENNVEHLAPGQFQVVSADYLDHTVRLLTSRSSVRISPDEALRYSCARFVPAPGTEAYLVRGVDFETLAGEFQPLLVRKRDTTLIVFFGAMGPGPTKLRSQPLIVWLKEKPDRIAVKWSTMR
jgi:hypothetical protein